MAHIPLILDGRQMVGYLDIVGEDEARIEFRQGKEDESSFHQARMGQGQYRGSQRDVLHPQQIYINDARPPLAAAAGPTEPSFHSFDEGEEPERMSTRPTAHHRIHIVRLDVMIPQHHGRGLIERGAAA